MIKMALSGSLSSKKSSWEKSEDWDNVEDHMIALMNVEAEAKMANYWKMLYESQTGSKLDLSAYATKYYTVDELLQDMRGVMCQTRGGRRVYTVQPSSKEGMANIRSLAIKSNLPVTRADADRRHQEAEEKRCDEYERWQAKGCDRRDEISAKIIDLLKAKVTLFFPNLHFVLFSIGYDFFWAHGN
jgi:hypothetical protein